jgi:hypothetical protein
MILLGFHTIDRMTVCSYEAGQRSGPLTLQILSPDRCPELDSLASSAACDASHMVA